MRPRGVAAGDDTARVLRFQPVPGTCVMARWVDPDGVAAPGGAAHALAPAGTSVHAITDGRVEEAGDDERSRVLVLAGADGLRYRYEGLVVDDDVAAPSRSVVAGDVLGTLGVAEPPPGAGRLTVTVTDADGRGVDAYRLLLGAPFPIVPGHRAQPDDAG